jgi:N-glycosylase/DNA lyase
MEDLLLQLQELRKNKIRRTIDSRLMEFKDNFREEEKIFSELCFCICTANNSAERGLKAQQEIDFCGLSETLLRKKMREVVCRFYNNKTEYIIHARSKKTDLLNSLRDFQNGKDARNWIVDNFKGLGFKESSHFLRNIGFCDVAIIDFHIVDLLVKNKIIPKPKSLTRKKYLEIEKTLEQIASRVGMDLAELDLYLWYMETGKVLK